MPEDASQRIEPTSRAERPIDEEDGLPLVGRVEVTELTDDDVRGLRDDLQR